MRVAFTGHRPEDLPNQGWVARTISSELQKLEVDKVFVGMAAGVDLIAGCVAVDAGYPVVACKPWAGHKPRLDKVNQQQYEKILGNASQVVDVDPNCNYPGVWVYHNRNKFMVDNSDLVVAVWSGKQSGGTFACVKYAKQKSKPLLQLNPMNETVQWVTPIPEPGLF